MKQPFSTPDAPSAPQMFSQAILTNGFIFVSGQVHVLPDNLLVQGTTAEKVEQIMKNIKAILEATGATLSNVVKVVIYVTDMAIMPELNEVYPSYFAVPFPVREAVCVQALPLGAQIEISVIATKEQ